MVFIKPSSKNELIIKGLGDRGLNYYYYKIDDKVNWLLPILKEYPIQGG